jgi:F-type H+-transporting ATPase subunit epsilon
MNLRIVVPFRLFLTQDAVSSVRVQTGEGSFELLAHRLDCVATLLPGLIAYTGSDHATVYAAVDGGILVKTGDDVVVCTRRAVAGADLAALHAAVTRDFTAVDAGEREARAAVGKMQGALMHRFAEMSRDR